MEKSPFTPPPSRSDVDALTSPLLSFAAEDSSALKAEAKPTKPPPKTQSLDFERIVNSYHIANTPLKKRFLIGYSGRTLTRWFLTLITGSLTGLLAVFICYTIEVLITARETVIDKLEIELKDDTPNFYLFFAFGGWNLFLAITASVCTIMFAPTAAGSGIPEVKAYLYGVRVVSFMNLRTFAVKVAGTILSVSSGLCVGPEGPLVHLGAIVGSSLTRSGQIANAVRRFRKRCPKLSGVVGCGHLNPTDEYDEYDGEENSNVSSYRSKDEEGEVKEKRSKKAKSRLPHFNFITAIVSYLSNFRNDGERRDLISIGAAAGFAAAFGAPIGGVLFSLEEASTFFTSKMLWRTLMATAVATFVIAVYYGDLTHYGVLMLDGIETPDDDVVLNRFQEVPLYGVMGVVGGLLGALFNGVWKELTRMRQEFYRDKSKIHKIWEVMLLSFFTSFFTFYLSLYCKWACRDLKIDGNSDDDNNGNHWWNNDDDDDGNGDHIRFDDGFGHRFNCGVNQTNELASVLFGNREDAIKNILKDPTAFDERTLLTVGLLFYCMLLLTFGAMLPSGIFMPLILIGASLGGYGGIMIERYIMSGISPSTFALVGVAALLGGVQRSTVSLCVIIMEGTGQIKFLIPIVITTVCARTVGDFFNHGIYELGMEMKNLPYLEHHVHKHWDLERIGNFMSKPVVTLKTFSTVKEIADVLQETTHHGFPVVDERGKYVGMVRRDQLAALIECGVFLEVEAETDAEVDGGDSFNAQGGMSMSLDYGDGRRGQGENENENENEGEDYVPSSPTTSLSFDGGRPRKQRKHRSFVSNRRVASLFAGNSCDFKRKSDYKAGRGNGDGDGDGVGGDKNAFEDNLNFIAKRNGKSNVDRESEIIEEALLIKDDRYKSRGLVTSSASRARRNSGGLVVVQVAQESLGEIVDIGGVMNLSPHVVLEDTPLSKAFKMFTTLGLRHLVVLGGPTGGDIVGIVTRVDWLSENIKKIK